MRLALSALLLFVASLLAFAQDAFAQDPRIYVVTHVDLMPNYAADGAKLLKQFAIDSHNDKGSVRFEVLGEPTRKNHFTIVSVWENQAAFDSHVEASHTREFREKVQPMLGGPLDERLHTLFQ
jgi:quinol monooxygenase YgiN